MADFVLVQAASLVLRGLALLDLPTASGDQHVVADRVVSLAFVPTSDHFLLLIPFTGLPAM
ncbi:hypothetical protein [Streptomyces sp. NPDC057889]|uniref:hypothetical protein n=1 Tax=unclassified Streptomyces TaxID=2593676 RepID=UPI0036C9D0AE